MCYLVSGFLIIVFEFGSQNKTNNSLTFVKIKLRILQVHVQEVELFFDKIGFFINLDEWRNVNSSLSLL